MKTGATIHLRKIVEGICQVYILLIIIKSTKQFHEGASQRSVVLKIMVDINDVYNNVKLMFLTIFIFGVSTGQLLLIKTLLLNNRWCVDKASNWSNRWLGKLNWTGFCRIQLGNVIREHSSVQIEMVTEGPHSNSMCTRVQQYWHHDINMAETGFP